MLRFSRAIVSLLLRTAVLVTPTAVPAAELEYPMIIRTRYEPVDARVGGQLIVWLEREKFHHGLDPRLYPAVRYVEVTQITPSVGSPPLTTIEVTTITSNTPEFYHIGGPVRFKVMGMTVRSTNLPH